MEDGVPVAFCQELESGEVRLHVLEKTKGVQVLLRTLAATNAEVWLPWKNVPGCLGLESVESVADWVIGRAALGCEVAGHKAGDADHEHELTPFERLVGLLRPEARDLLGGRGVLGRGGHSVVGDAHRSGGPRQYRGLRSLLSAGRGTGNHAVYLPGLCRCARALIAYVVEIIQRRLFIRVVEDLAYRLPSVDPVAMESKYGPRAVNRFFDIVTVQKVVSTLLVDGVSLIIQTAIGMFILAFYHPFLLGYDVVLLILFAVVVFGLGRGAVKTAIKESKAKYHVAYWLEELTRLPTAFKLHSGPQFAMGRADQLAIEWLDARRKHFRVVIRQMIFALGLQAIASTVLLGLGGWLVITGELTLGQLVAAELIVMMIVGSFTKLGKHLESFYDLLASVDKLGALFDLPIEPHDDMFHLAKGTPAAVTLRGAWWPRTMMSRCRWRLSLASPWRSVATGARARAKWWRGPRWFAEPRRWPYRDRRH